ncbi:hypothetical protein [Limosilactobacillus reuteri]|nr:hypothetical protein [Limosilactobacillus reuteri]
MQENNSLVFKEVNANELYSSTSDYIIGTGIGFAAGMGLVYIAVT